MSDKSENSMAANLVAARGNRCTAAIMGFLEANVYDYIPADLKPLLRQVVLDQINGFKDLTIDIVKSDTAVLNQFWVEKIDKIHEDLRNELRAFRKENGASVR